VNGDYVDGSVYCLRCVRCLMSFCGGSPRELAARYGAHSCDLDDVASLAAFRAAAAWLESIKQEGNP
jgi:hypothetical protein